MYLCVYVSIHLRPEHHPLRLVVVRGGGGAARGVQQAADLGLLLRPRGVSARAAAD